MGALLILTLVLWPMASTAETIIIDNILVRSGERLSRPATEINPVEQALVDGAWAAPAAGTEWKQAVANETGWFHEDDLIHGHAYAEIELAEAGTWVLDAMGYAGVYINGEPRIGNIYGYTDDWESWQPHFDFSRLPVHLKAGTNTFLFYGNRYGRMRAQLTAADRPLALNARDVTLPDLVVGQQLDSWGAIVVLNATDEVVSDAVMEIRVDGGRRTKFTVPILPPYGVRKVGFPLHARDFEETGTKGLQVTLKRDGETFDVAELPLQVKQKHENRRITFVSEIDGSVQYYGYLPATGTPGSKALFLSLHGASVEAINQSGSYAPLSWGHVVAPTNRRPFGFSWEDWGRLDALEVLDQALTRLDIDQDRIYLTGHSMGGHGSWHLATHYPDRFAAVGPSAGWITIWSYRRQAAADEASPLTALIERGTLPSETLEMAPNLKDLGVYVLHGADDDNVPPAQAHLMLDRLGEFHHDFVYHEQPGVRHWWDLSNDAGADCVSWPPMFDFFARHRRPAVAEIREIQFRTASPSVSAWNRWACIGAQQQPFVMSSLDLERDEEWHRVSGTTQNTTLLGLDLSHSGQDSLKIEIDGDKMTVAVPDEGPLWLERAKRWRPVAQPDPSHKGIDNNGGFRAAFDRRVQLVYATGGTKNETAWALAKARYDAEYLWYQGNASVDVLPDTLFDPKAEPDRNVVLYGNADSHQHWAELWQAEVHVRGLRLQVGDHEVSGGGMAVLAVYPRPGSTVAKVGLVSATGAQGRRLMNHRPYLQYGVAYPDVTVFYNHGGGSTEFGAGYFGNDWAIESGEFIWVDKN